MASSYEPRMPQEGPQGRLLPANLSLKWSTPGMGMREPRGRAMPESSEAATGGPTTAMAMGDQAQESSKTVMMRLPAC